MDRPDKHEYFLNIAKACATRSNCYRRVVGCVLVDSHDRILATGYNGVPHDFPHCQIGECPREGKESGTSLNTCHAIHAEQNALLFCSDINKIKSAYITVSPCLACTVMLLNTSCEQIIFADAYPNNDQARSLWIMSGRVWAHHG